MIDVKVILLKDQKKAEEKKKELKRKATEAKDKLAKLTNYVKYDVKAIKERDPAAKSTAEVLLLYSGLHALVAYRVAHEFYIKGNFLAARAISQFARHCTGIEIHPGAEIGKGLVIDHGMGVVIGETTIIGDDCTIYQGVTLGGTGKDKGKRHPTLGNGVMVGAGAKVLGPFTIGDNTKIAANAVVLAEIPENCTAVGIPAKVVKREGQRIDQLDHVNIPDPVAQQIKSIEAKLKELEEQIKESRTQE